MEKKVSLLRMQESLWRKQLVVYEIPAFAGMTENFEHYGILQNLKSLSL